MKQIEVGIAYALWGALGTVIVNTVGIVFFGESHDFAKLAWIALILCGVVRFVAHEWMYAFRVNKPHTNTSMTRLA